jgi:hypothetical protein
VVAGLGWEADRPLLGSVRRKADLVGCSVHYALKVLVYVLRPKGRLEHQCVTYGRRYEVSFTTCGPESLEVPLAVRDPIILVGTAVQPKGFYPRCRAPLEEHRIDDFIVWASPPEPPAVKVDGAAKRIWPHPGIRDGQDTPRDTPPMTSLSLSTSGRSCRWSTTASTSSTARSKPAIAISTSQE